MSQQLASAVPPQIPHGPANDGDAFDGGGGGGDGDGSADADAGAARDANAAAEAGRSAFKSQDYERAAHLWSVAIGHGEVTAGGAARDGVNVQVLYSNRSEARRKLGRHEGALDDAVHALRLLQYSRGDLGKLYRKTPSGASAPRAAAPFVKAFHRKAAAEAAMGYDDQALRTYLEAIRFVAARAKQGDAGDDASTLASQKVWLKRQAAAVKRRVQQQKKAAAGGAAEGAGQGPSSAAAAKPAAAEPKGPRMQDFEVEDRFLGEGNYSAIWKVKEKATGKVFALKVLEKKKVTRMKIRHPNIMNEIEMEKRVLNKLKMHPNVITLHATFSDYYSMYFLLDFVEGGELWRKLIVDGLQVGLFESRARFYMAQLQVALEHLARNGIVHRDLKPENMLLTAKGQLKLIDFGTAKDTVDTALNGPNFVGTPEYMSPEAVSNKAAAQAADVWAYGCCIFQIVAACPPFKAASAYLSFQKVKARGMNWPAVVRVRPTLIDLVDRMLRVDPADRIALSDVRNHPWYTDAGYFADGDGLARECPADVMCPDGEPPLTPHEQRVTDIGENAHKGKFATLHDLDPLLKTDVMHYLAVRRRLAIPHVFKLFFPSEHEARFHRASDRGLVGFSQAEEGAPASFLMAALSAPRIGDGALGGGADGQQRAAMLKRAVAAINKLRPLPRVLLVCGNMVAVSSSGACTTSDISAFQTILSDLDKRVAIACIPGESEVGASPSHASVGNYREHFGEDYYSFWVGGSLVIAANSPLMNCRRPKPDEKLNEVAVMAGRQDRWLRQHIMEGKLSARHTIVVTHHPWYFEKGDPCPPPKKKGKKADFSRQKDKREDSSSDSDGGDDDDAWPADADGTNDPVEQQNGMRCLARSKMLRYMPQMRDAGTGMLLTAYPGGRNRRRKLKAHTDVYNPMNVAGIAGFTETPPSQADKRDGNVALIRVLQTKVVHDCYTIAELESMLGRDVNLRDSDGEDGPET